MREPQFLCLALLFGLCALTNAAPPPNSQSSALLSLVNATASFAALRNITIPHGSTRISVGPPFPPGPEPPEDVIFYDVPFSNPPVNLKFKLYELDPKRNETEVDELFQKAVMECGDREKHFIEMQQEETQYWDDGHSFLQILPKRIGPKPEQGLTYGIFTDALQGLNNFRLFYPHLNFHYEIYVYPGEEQDETYVGVGQLSSD